MLQIRVSLPAFNSGVAFSDPIILENAEGVALVKTINSSDESISFDLPLNDPKLSYITYLRWWECWDTVTNKRLNYGPIHSITRNPGQSKRVTGPGRSALLNDYYKTIQTFYYPIDTFLDDLRYENIAGQPRASTHINKNSTSIYYGLSGRTKDRAIDEQTGYIAIGRDAPIRGIRRTDSYWGGTGKADWLIIDLGGSYTISKVRLLTPWWGGATINNNRRYFYQLQYSNGTNYTDPNANAFTTVYTTSNATGDSGDPASNGRTFYFGESGFETSPLLSLAEPVIARYWKINITDTTAYYGNVFTGESHNEWDWECGQTNIFNGITKPSPSVSTGTLIGTTELTISNDCFASVVEFAANKRILERDTISKLAYHQIDGNNRQITYYHVPAASEMSAGGTKFEPGTFFRKFTYTSGGSVTVKDDYNVPIFSGGSGSTVRCPAYSKYVTFSGAAQVVEADTWPGRLDPLSYGGSYSFSTITNDTATLHFRGVSFKWYATIPSDQTPANVRIRLRAKDDGSVVWGGWTTLVASMALPSNVSAKKVYEITYESGILILGKTYQLEILNLNGGFVSIDSFAGHWEGTMNLLNEDDARVRVRLANEEIQEYNMRFSSGSIYRYKPGTGSLTKQSLAFTGDRIILYSRKGPGYGIIKIALFYGGVIVPIIGGVADGSLEVNLNSTYDITQAVVFDSDEYFVDPNDALKWGSYTLGIYRPDNTDVLWVDGFEVHETTGLSVKFVNTTHLDILKSVGEALQMEWDVTEVGVKVVPRLGTDTDVIFSEGHGTTIEISDVEDAQQVATMLISAGADIDGLPLTTVVEDRNTREVIGRTIQRTYDVRNVGDYFTLVGAARSELLRRAAPQRRVTVRTTDPQGVTYGDSFIVNRPGYTHRVRAISINRTQSSGSGTNYEMDCTEWPAIT